MYRRVLSIFANELSKKCPNKIISDYGLRIGIRYRSLLVTHGTLYTRGPKSKSPVASIRKESNGKRVVDVDWRPMTLQERIKEFPASVKRLWKHYELYGNIHNASKTKRNAWSSDSPHNTPLHQGNIGDNPYPIHHLKNRPGLVPRRQYEQQRQFIEALKLVSPTVLVWILPIVGTIPMVLAVAAPRQLLSRHFHNDFEVAEYARQEFSQRLQHFQTSAKLFQDLFGEPLRSLLLEGNGDAAGPILNALPLLTPFGNPANSRKATIAIDGLSGGYLKSFALSVGVLQSLPRGWAPKILEVLPHSYLRFRIQDLAKRVSLDDSFLLYERHHENNCASLTEEELLDAALLRNLPVDVSFGEMRTCLTNHLQLVASVRLSLQYDPADEVIGLWTLHLSLIRHFLQAAWNPRTK